MHAKTVTIPEAVATVNRFIIMAQKEGKLPALDSGPTSDLLPNVEQAQKFATSFPGYHLEFHGPFTCRVRLSATAAIPCWPRPAEVTVGTSGNVRTIEESEYLAKDLVAVNAVARQIRDYLEQVDPQPTPEAIQRKAKYDAQREANAAALAAKVEAEKQAAASLRAKKTKARRRLHRLIEKGDIGDVAAGRVSRLLDDGKVDEAAAILRTIPG